jgi:hypothetical protein
MRCLFGRAQRERKGYVKSATLQDLDGVLARGAWDTRSSLSKMDNSATICLAHLHSLCLQTETLTKNEHTVATKMVQTKIYISLFLKVLIGE